MFVPLLGSILYVFDTIVGLYLLVVIVAVVVSWLVAFGVLNIHNALARQLVNILDSLTEPVFRQVRRVIPPIGGLDLSPLVVIIVLRVLQTLVDGYVSLAMVRL